MKLMSYRHGARDSFGVVVDGGVIDMGSRLGPNYRDLRSAIAGNKMIEIAALAASKAPDFSLDEVEYLPVIPNPDKIFAAGLNYHAHVQETGRTESEKPVIFLRLASAQVGHGQPMIRPKVSERFDYEGEVAVIIGKEGRHIPEDKAYDYVAGYSCYNEGSVRDWQLHTHQWVPGKNFEGTGGFGPWMVTADEIPDPESMRLTTRLNGEVMQDTTVDKLIFSIPELIAYLSTVITLIPGDVIVSGTPGGVGAKRQPPVWMRAGDVCEIEVSGVGVLRNPIIDEA
jgi:2-keto-4-pentenoate hydratase/2-oxohepta-3-ene-1,7-dioic acid hydratase in catechol pathway